MNHELTGTFRGGEVMHGGPKEVGQLDWGVLESRTMMGEEVRWGMGVKGSGGVQSPQSLQAERKVFLGPCVPPH